MVLERLAQFLAVWLRIAKDRSVQERLAFHGPDQLNVLDRYLACTPDYMAITSKYHPRSTNIRLTSNTQLVYSLRGYSLDGASQAGNVLGD